MSSPCHSCPNPPESCDSCTYLAGTCCGGWTAQEEPHTHEPDPEPETILVREYVEAPVPGASPVTGPAPSTAHIPRPAVTMSLVEQIVRSYRRRGLHALNPELAAVRILEDYQIYRRHAPYNA